MYVPVTRLRILPQVFPLPEQGFHAASHPTPGWFDDHLVQDCSHWTVIPGTGFSCPIPFLCRAVIGSTMVVAIREPFYALSILDGPPPASRSCRRYWVPLAGHITLGKLLNQQRQEEDDLTKDPYQRNLAKKLR